MPKSLQKVQKHVRKKKGQTTALHENSRDAQRIRRAHARDDKVGRHEYVRQLSNVPYIERVQFFKDKVGDDRMEPLEREESENLILKYLARHEPLLNSFAEDRRPGRPPPKQLEAVKAVQLAEQREYVSGLWVPDMEDAANLEMLRMWRGEWSALATVRFVRITKAGVRTESRFPPNGRS